VSSVLAIFEFTGEIEDLRSRFDGLLHRVVEISSGRPIIHLAVPVPTGLNVYDVWDSETAFRSFSENPDFLDALEAFGMSNPKVTVLPVHNVGWPVSGMPLYR
jgi:hypothetical protein